LGRSACRKRLKESSRGGGRRIFYPASCSILFDPGELPPVQPILLFVCPGFDCSPDLRHLLGGFQESEHELDREFSGKRGGRG